MIGELCPELAFRETSVIIQNTDLATRPADQLVPTDDCCDDCPEINSDPPSKSDCPYFGIVGGIAICDRPGGMERQIKQFLAGGGTI